MRLPPRYRVTRHIANGGMASVWEAEDGLLGRAVAVKLLAPGFAAEPSARRRFLREARAAARVSDHPNVVTIYDIGEHEGQAFIVMEYFPGGSVADRLRGDAAVSVPRALDWLEQAASALDAAHAAGIVHRDVKPGNLMLDAQGRLAVGDFGIASIAGESRITQAGQVLGTAAYLSPEQARGEPATAASDRYALAVVAHELISGGGPPPGTSAGAGVIAGGLASDPALRPRSAAAFVHDLRRALDDRVIPKAAAPPAVTEVLPVRPGPPRPRRLALPAFLLAVLCLLGVAVAVVSSGDDGDGERAAAPATKTTTSRPARTTARTASTPAAAPATSTATQAATAPAPAPAATQPQTSTSAVADSRSPRQLNDAGYAALPSDPTAAVPLLQASVEGFRAAGKTKDINYVFALYNLGWALNLAGRHAEAVPYLEERLRISNYKRGIVRKELAAARRAASAGDT